MAVDPTTIRLSDNFLLSDFVGCFSCYAKGYRNRVQDSDREKIVEGQHLAESALEQIIEQYGPVSVSYGFLSPELSRKIVSYQSPDAPSYHRWDKGAAADICVHSWVRREDGAPINLAMQIADEIDFSRMITYSESPFICVAANSAEVRPRKAFYENRYMGFRRPVFRKVPASEFGSTVELEVDWRGAGYPTYHGGGVRQYHHVRCGQYNVVSDFLYHKNAVHKGIANRPMIDASAQNVRKSFRRAGRVMEHLYSQINGRFSLLKAYVSRYTSRTLGMDAGRAWEDDFVLDIAPPEGLDIADVAALLKGAKHIGKVQAKRKASMPYVRIYGSRHRYVREKKASQVG